MTGRLAVAWRPGFRCLLAALLLAGLARQVAAAEPLRLCADPDNLPFSSADPAVPGIYIELGRLLAEELGRPFEAVWAPTYMAKREIRTTLLAGRCDGFLGLPVDPGFMAPRVILSKPILELGFALVLPQDMAVSGLADLAGRRVAVQFNSPPQSLLATRADIQAVTAMSPEEAMADLAEGKADAAFTWGPTAGWINRSALDDAYRVLPVAGDHMQWESAIGFAQKHAALRDEIDRALAGLDGAIDALMAKYGFPSAAPMRLAEAGEAATPATAAAAAPAAGGTGASAPSATLAAAPAADGLDDPGTIAAGHKLFNANCAHCHGPDAVQGERRINLRLLQHRHGDTMDEIFLTTVHQGRVTKGMPKWGGILSDAEFHEILAFLHSVQDP